MKQITAKSSQPTLEQIGSKLEQWRKIKRHCEPIPKDLWQAAAELAKKHSINTVSKTLRLSYADLKDRVHPSNPKSAKKGPFIELGYTQPFSGPETTLEMENKKGSRLKISFKGRVDLDLMDLARTFLQKNL